MPATKTASKKLSKQTRDNDSGKRKKETGIKYTDKSPSQPQLTPVFEAIKKLLLPYEKGTMKLITSGGQVVLISKKPVEILGRKRDELWFASALVQKGYVGFYYLPVYGDPKVKEFIKPELLKCLKGKSCFHIRHYDEQIFSQVKDALSVGYELWQKRGWL
jgi:hypothetical protein